MPLAVTNSHIIVTRGLLVDCFDQHEHVLFNLQDKVKLQEDDYITDLSVAPNENKLAIVTAVSKCLLIFDYPHLMNLNKSHDLPKTVSRIRFTPDSEKILVADKNGDVLLYNTKPEEGGTKVLGHLSLLLDVLQTPDDKFIISCDRDEKIKVSCCPKTYNIHSYCLGHTEFVNHLELLPHDNEYLTSTSGDGTIKCWNYREGKLCYTIDTSLDISNKTTLEDFTKIMDEEGVEVTKLPIVHFAITSLNENSSLLALTLHSSNILLVYTIQALNSHFTHKLEQKINFKNVPAAIKFHNSKLYVFNDIDSAVIVYEVSSKDDNVELCEVNEIKMFTGVNTSINSTESTNKYIKALYKRKFDNVQEYLKRKMLRLEKKM